MAGARSSASGASELIAVGLLRLLQDVVVQGESVQLRHNAGNLLLVRGFHFHGNIVSTHGIALAGHRCIHVSLSFPNRAVPPGYTARCSCPSAHQSDYERGKEYEDKRQPPAPAFRQGALARHPGRNPEKCHDGKNERWYGQERQQNILRSSLRE